MWVRCEAARYEAPITPLERFRLDAPVQWAGLMYGAAAVNKVFSLEVEFAGMLAPEVQANTITNRVPLLKRDSQSLLSQITSQVNRSGNPFDAL